MRRTVHPWLPFVVVTSLLGACAVVAAVFVPGPSSRAAFAPCAPFSLFTPSAPSTLATTTTVPVPGSTSASSGNDDATDDEAAPARMQALRGLWSRHPETDGRDDAPVSFYYFHEGDLGLYRYGHVSYNTTNSYHWSIRSDDLELRWNKTGAVTRLPYRIDRSSARPVLVIEGDPKHPEERSTRYTFVPAPDSSSWAPDLLHASLGPSISANHKTLDRIDNRLWIDLQRFATGGIGFSLWQLRAQGIDGRGTGWHHVGDFDDWSTEQLTYRSMATGEQAGVLEVLFSWRKERATTAWSLRRDSDARVLRLAVDPRDFGAMHDYVDAGPSFSGFGLSR